MCKYGLFYFVYLVVSVLCGPVKESRSNPRIFEDNLLRGGNECNCVCGTSNRHMRVVGGNITKLHEFPWLAGLSKGGEFHCGASLITRRHLITAAHCVDGFEVDDLTVVLADHDRTSPDRPSEVVVRGLISVKQHEHFDVRTFNNDIAVLEMDEPVQFDAYVQPVCLPEARVQQDYAGRLAVVAGWGRTGEREDPSKVLRKAVVPVWSEKECHGSGYEVKKISTNMFCAGVPDGKRDACQGDSGGPLLLNRDSGNMEVIGLVSWGRGCARPNLPGIYTKVANYVDWLNESLDGECLCASMRLNPRRA